MKNIRMPQITVLSRTILFFVAFFIALICQMCISHIQTKWVMEPMEIRTGNIQAISQFLNEVEECMTVLENYRWDYGDTQALVTSIAEHQAACAGYLERVPSDIREVGEEQYLLANAARTTYQSLTILLDSIVEKLTQGQSDEAAMLYYDRAEPCGDYLRQYTQQLLEQALLDNQDAYASLKTLNQRLREIQTAMVVACLVLGGVVLVSVIHLLRSVLQMSRVSQAISRGEFDIPDIDESQRDEIGHMARAFNEMKHSMKHQVQLLNEKNEMERVLHIKEKEALELQTLMEREKLQQLRSQINPHFLFNTLNMIMYTAQQEGALRTRTLIASLSRLFRNALSSNDVQVPLSREVQLVDEFYSLYHARFGERMKMKWHISSELELTETVIPSFILQPLVENAFCHGLSPKEEGGCVNIYVQTDAELLFIKVSDNGVGISKDALEALKENMKTPFAGSEHIGMTNVAARLQLWDKESSMDIWSTEGKGTVVTLQIPLVTMEEGDLYD